MDMSEVRKLAPAVFADKPYPGVSDSYVFIPTLPVVERLLAQGWQITSAVQTRSVEKEPYARHALRITLPTMPIVGECRPELLLVNGHDGSATYALMVGLYRFICTNGMVVGQTLGALRIRHMGYAATVEAVEQGAMKLAVDEVPKLVGAIDSMRAKELTRSQQHDFANHALDLRYPGSTQKLLNSDQLLTVHRPQDAGNDVWHVFNVIQENVTQRTHDSRSYSGRRSHIRGIRAIRENVAINRGLWDYAAKLAA